MVNEVLSPVVAVGADDRALLLRALSDLLMANLERSTFSPLVSAVPDDGDGFTDLLVSAVEFDRFDVVLWLGELESGDVVLELVDFPTTFVVAVHLHGAAEILEPLCTLVVLK